jgi:hypothetical protein
MTYGEAMRLTQRLAHDPASQVCAALSEWDAPRSHEWLLLADTYDATVQANFKGAKPYPRPYPEPGTTRRGHTKRSRAEVLAILAAHGHDIREHA